MKKDVVSTAEQTAEKLAKLREVYLKPEDQRVITDTELALRRNVKRAKLAERAEVKEVVADTMRRLEEIDFLLANDEDLTEIQRHDLFSEKKVHRFWMERLDGSVAEEAVKYISETVDILGDKPPV